MNSICSKVDEVRDKDSKCHEKLERTGAMLLSDTIRT